LGQFSQLPDFNMYLVTIFGQAGAPEVVRQRAGLLLKTQVRSQAVLPAAVTEHVTRHIMSAMQDSSRTLRHTAGTMLTTMVQKCGLEACHSALQQLLLDLANSNPALQEGSLSALGKICEDALANVQKAIAGSGHASANDAQLFVRFASESILPKLLDSATPAAPDFMRQGCLECLNHFALSSTFENGKCAPLERHRSRYVEVLGALASDSNTDVMQQVCRGFSCSMEYNWNCLSEQHSKAILEFMLKAAQHSSYEVRLEALAVWKFTAAKSETWGVVGCLLPQLLPVLLANMVYAEADYMILDQSHLENDNADRHDSLDEIKPRFHNEKDNIDGEEDDGEVPEAHTSHSWGAEWTGRKAAASSLDALSEIFEADITQNLLPLIQQKLQDASWEQQEAGVLAIGAIGVNCMKRLAQFLPAVMEHVLGLCASDKPLLRSISCWCISRFSDWICKSQNQNQQQVIAAVLRVLLERSLDRNKQVQNAALTAVARMLESGGAVLTPFLDDIVQTLSRSFQLYKPKNIQLLYDTIGTCAWTMGPALNQPKYIESLMKPLVQKFESTPDGDVTALPLFECLTYILQTLGKSITSVIPKFTMRAVQIVNETSHALRIWQQRPDEYERPDRELMAASVDLLAAVVEGLQEQGPEAIAKMNFLSILPLALQENSSRTKQSGFWLWGSCTAHCMVPLSAILPQLIPFCVNGLGPSVSITVNSNAAWALSETSRKMPAEVNPHLGVLIPPLVAILQRKDGIDIKPWQRQGHGQLLRTVCFTLTNLRQYTALGEKWPTLYQQLPADLRGHLQATYGLTA